MNKYELDNLNELKSVREFRHCQLSRSIQFYKQLNKLNTPNLL